MVICESVSLFPWLILWLMIFVPIINKLHISLHSTFPMLLRVFKLCIKIYWWLNINVFCRWGCWIKSFGKFDMDWYESMICLYSWFGFAFKSKFWRVVIMVVMFVVYIMLCLWCTLGGRGRIEVLYSVASLWRKQWCYTVFCNMYPSRTDCYCIVMAIAHERIWNLLFLGEIHIPIPSFL